MTTNHTEKHTYILNELLERASKHFDQAEVFSLQTKTLSVEHRNGQLKETSETESKGLCLRIIEGNKIAQVSTSNLEKAFRLIEDASELVQFGETVQFSFPNDAKIPEITSLEPEENSLSQMIQLGDAVMDELQSFDRQLMISSGSTQEITTVQIINSNGFNHTYTHQAFTSAAAGILAEEGNILTAFKYQIGSQLSSDASFFTDPIKQILKIAGKNIPFQSGSLKVLFSPYALSDLISAFAQGISGMSIVKGTSPLINKIGSEIMDKRISIIDDPLFPDAAGSVPFDDEGVPSRRKYLVKNGVLSQFLLNLKSSATLKLPPSGNGFRYTSLINNRSYVDAPSPSFTNLIIPEGERTVDEVINSNDELLVIHQLTGVLLGNLINGDWSGNITLGVLYKNGEPIGRIKNAMTGGNIYEMFMNHYIESSKERDWIGGFGSGGGYRFLPYMLFDHVNVSV